jgi:hypothetical protein
LGPKFLKVVSFLRPQACCGSKFLKAPRFLGLPLLGVPIFVEAHVSSGRKVLRVPSLLRLQVF